VPYTNLISRTDAQALMPEEVVNDLLGGLSNESAALTMFRTVPMARGQVRMPVLSVLPTAYFVNGDTGLKQTTEADWANKYLNAEELAAIVPIPENVLDDADYDIWGEITPLLQQAVGRAIDAAVFFGTNKPSSWPNAVVADAVTAGQTVTRGTNAAAAGGIYGDLSALYAAVETSGYDVNGLIANTFYKGYQRNARSTQGVKLDDAFAAQVAEDIKYPMRGLWPTGSGSAEVVGGDFSQGILGLRKDFTYKVLDQAVIQDNTGAIVYNLAQQDMVGLRIVFRCAFQVANLINWDKPTQSPTDAIGSGSRYPFAVLRAA
jgi:hypothetical protein